jgi:hypothetical protein
VQVFQSLCSICTNPQAGCSGEHSRGAGFLQAAVQIATIAILINHAPIRPVSGADCQEIAQILVVIFCADSFFALIGFVHDQFVFLV